MITYCTVSIYQYQLILVILKLKLNHINKQLFIAHQTKIAAKSMDLVLS